MADLSPFLSNPQKWIEELAKLRSERQKIEEREDRLKTKLRSHFDQANLTELAADSFLARIEKRESTDFSQKALTEYMGKKKFAALKESLPVKVSESLVIREIKKEEASPNSKTEEIATFFGAQEKKKGALPWQK